MPSQGVPQEGLIALRSMPLSMRTQQSTGSFGTNKTGLGTSRSAMWRWGVMLYLTPGLYQGYTDGYPPSTRRVAMHTRRVAQWARSRVFDSA